MAQYHKEFTAYEDRLRVENQQLSSSADATDADEESAQALLRKKQAFEKRVVTIQRKAEDRRKKLSEAHARVLEGLHQVLNDVIKEVGAERHLALIIPQSSAVFFQLHLDISDLIKERLSQKIALKPGLLKVNVND